MPSPDAEQRIMRAVEKVGEKVDDLRTTTGEFQMVTAVAIAKIQEIERGCPINEVVATLRDVEKVADQAKAESRRTAILISTGLGALWTAVLAFFGWHQSGGSG